MRKFVIVSHSRSGSNLLVRSLNAHPDVCCAGEILKREFHDSVSEFGRRMHASDTVVDELLSQHECDAVAFMDGFFRLAAAQGAGAAGFKLFYYHAREPARKVVWERLYESEDIDFLHLYRGNLLDSFLSRALAIKSGSWTSKGDVDFDYRERVVVDINAFRAFCEDIHGYRAEIAERLPKERVREIEYRTLTEAYPETMYELQRDLDVTPIDIKQPMSRQRKRDRWAYIENAEEVRSFLEHAGMARFL